MRNRLAYGYFGINNEILWRVVAVETPKLHKILKNIQLSRPELFEGQT